MTNPQPTAEEQYQQKPMPGPEDAMKDLQDLLFGLRPKSKDVIETCEEYAEKMHQSRLQAISEEVEKRQEELGQAAYLHDKNGNIHEAYKARCKNEAYSEILEIITNHTSDD